MGKLKVTVFGGLESRIVLKRGPKLGSKKVRKTLDFQKIDQNRKSDHVPPSCSTNMVFLLPQVLGKLVKKTVDLQSKCAGNWIYNFWG